MNVKREDIIGKANCNVKALSSINDSSIKTDLAVINEKKRIIYTQEINIDEQVKEFEIIKLLSMNAGQIFDREKNL